MKLHRTTSSLALTLALVAPPAAGQIVSTESWVASDASGGDRFGASVAISGDIAVIGASRSQSNGTTTGAAYLFQVSTGQEFSKLLATDGADFDNFGYSVAIDGGSVIVGANLADPNGVRSGSAYLFDAFTGQQLAKLLPGDGAAEDFFGSSVGISGDHAIVGSPYDDDNGADSGAAYLYQVSTGQQLTKLAPLDTIAGDKFGWRVAISGNVIAVSAPDDGYMGFPKAGSIYLFQLSTGQQLAKLRASDFASGDMLGSSLAISGDFLVAGAPGDDDNASAGGAGYVFQISTGQEVTKLVPDDGGIGDQLAFSGAAISGDYAALGSQLDEDYIAAAGSAYLFQVSTGQQVAKLVAAQPAGYFGTSVAFSGNRVLVGGPTPSNGNGIPGFASVIDLSQPLNYGAPYCFGDGSGTPCPCGAQASQNEGCPNTSGQGGRLRAYGNAIVSADSFRLLASDLPQAVSAIAFRGLDAVQGGLGSPAGAGLLCTTGDVIRSQVQFTSFSDLLPEPVGSTLFTDFQGQALGQVVGLTGTQSYQVWYRDPTSSCGSSGFNFTNAWNVTWLP